MNGSAFDIAAVVMSYWLAALMLFLLYKLVRSVMRDYRAQRTFKKAASGFAMGFLEVVWPEADGRGKANPNYGKRYALRRENTIGSGRGADIRLKDDTVAPAQATVYQKGNKIMLADTGTRQGVGLNGYRVKDDTALLDGDEIMLGNVVLLLHVKGGTATQRDVPYAQRDESYAQRDVPYAQRDGTEEFDTDASERDFVDREEDGEYGEYDADEAEFYGETETGEYGEADDTREYGGQDDDGYAQRRMSADSDDDYVYGRAYDPFADEPEGEDGEAEEEPETKPQRRSKRRRGR